MSYTANRVDKCTFYSAVWLMISIYWWKSPRLQQVVYVCFLGGWEDMLTLPTRESFLSIHQWEQEGRFGVPSTIKGKITSVHCPSILSQLRWLSSLPSGSPPGILFICWVFRYCPAPWPQLHSLGCLLTSLSQVQRTFLRIRIALHIS